MKFNDTLTKPHSIRLEPTDVFTLSPGNNVTVKHYNGLTTNFKSLGFCKLVYRGGLGFDILPICCGERDIEITLVEPSIKSHL